MMHEQGTSLNAILGYHQHHTIEIVKRANGDYGIRCKHCEGFIIEGDN